MGNVSTLGGILIIIVIGLIILLVISFVFFISRLLINTSEKSNQSNELENKIDKLIEQNEKIISLLKERK